MARASRDMVLELVDVGREPPASLVTAKLVRKVDVDRALHDRRNATDAVAFQCRSGFHDIMTRWLILLSLFVASPAPAQWVFNPAASYITSGQDEPGYRAWMARANWRPVYVKAFNDYLVSNVDATRWRRFKRQDDHVHA